jgi:chromosome segregation and condensation protein ScpB
LIQRSGDDGVTNSDLCEILDVARETVKAHVFQLNEQLAGTDYQIACRGRGYRLVRAAGRVHVA